MAYRNLTDKQRELADMMSGTSGRLWCAGWLIGCEFSLWMAITEKSDRSLYEDLTHGETRKLKELSDECGGWIVWRDTDESETFVPMSEWLEIYNRKIGASKP